MECINCGGSALKLFTVYDHRGLPLKHPYCASCYAIVEYDRLVAQTRSSFCRVFDGTSPSSLLRPLLQNLAHDLLTLSDELRVKVSA